MKYTKSLFGKDAREALKLGADQVNKAVSCTLGAKGRNGVYMEYGMPTVTNDGVSIARRIRPEDKFESIGAELIKQSAERTNEEAGDGTTSSIIVSHALIEEGLKKIDAGANPMEIRRELENARDEAVKQLKSMSIEVKTDAEILDVAKISVEDDKIAQIVTDAVKKAGSNGAVIVEESVGYSIEKDEVQGYFWDKGYVSPYMVTNERGEAILEEVPVIVTDRYMNLNKELVMTIDSLMKQGYKSALVIADKIEGELLQTIILNKIKGNFVVVGVQRPSTVQELEDIATLVHGTAITKDKGIKDIAIQHIGKAKKIIVKKDSTTIIGNDSVELQARILQLKEELKDDKDNDLLKARIAKLASGIVILRVGSKTEADRKYLKLKVDDAVSACRAAIQEGIVEGAGVALKKIAEASESEIFRNACNKPFAKILENAGIENDGKYYNVKTGKVVKDLVKEGIVDPTKVIRCEIENAVSIAGIFLTIESVTADYVKDDVKQEQF